MVPNGDGPRDHPLLKPLNLPPLGNPGRELAARDEDAALRRRRRSDHGGAGTRLPPEMPQSIAPGAGGRKFRAYDKATGAVLWETELPAGTTGAPMTYMFEGKQYIVVAVGSREAAVHGICRAQPAVIGMSAAGHLEDDGFDVVRGSNS